MPAGRNQPVYRLTSPVKPWLLLLLRMDSAHGYDLARRLSQHGVKSDTATLYRALRALETDGLARSDWSTSDTGPARRVYKLTRRGRRQLDDSAREMAEARATFDAFLTHYDRMR